MKTFQLILFCLVAFFLSACLEEGESLRLRLFAAEYNTNLPPGVDAGSVEELVAAHDVRITGTAQSFVPDDNLDNELLQNRIQLFGDTATSNSSILITMNRSFAADPEYAHAIVMEVIGPFTVNQATTQGFAEISLGDPTANGLTLTTEARPDTYFRFTLTELDIANERIAGNFEFLAKNDNASFSCSVFDGVFTWDID